MLRMRRREMQPRDRYWSIVAGASFVVTAVGWLIFNEQRRRARSAFLNSLMHWPPHTRKWISALWRSWNTLWVDPWGRYRQRVAGDATGDVLEIGVGSWRNLIYYRSAERLVGIEASRRHFAAARRRLRRLRPQAELVRARPERLPFPDAYFDTVVASLSLCTVRDQQATMEELARVLRPCGTLRFLEHVRSHRHSVALMQDLLTPFWRIAVDGCHPNRDTLAAIEQAGFVVVSLESLRVPAGPLLPTLCGVARRCHDHAGEDVP